MSEHGARMKGGAVMCDISPLTVARNCYIVSNEVFKGGAACVRLTEMKSFKALRFPNLATILIRTVDLSRY